MEWQFIAVGIFMATIVVVALVRENSRIDKLESNGIRAQGEVLRNKIKWGRNTVVRAIIQFTTNDGRVIEAEDQGIAMLIPKYSKGQKVVLLYDENNPQNFTVLSSGNWG